MAEFRAFLDWVTGTRTMRESAASIGISRQAFASRVAWCWNVRPAIAPDGVVHHYLEADGTYVPYGWCLLVATGEDGRPLAWQWCDKENAAAYRGLFGGIARPDVLVTDGGAGCVAAAGGLWEGVRVQRCLVHVLRNTRRDLTGRPRSEAGRGLLRLARRITKVADAAGAAAWLAALNAWHAEYGSLVRQRTRAGEDPGNPKARAGRKWWYTHERLRRAYFRFVGLNRRGVLFAFCNPVLAGTDGWRPRADGGRSGSIHHEPARGRRQRRYQARAERAPRPGRGAHEALLRMGRVHEKREPRPRNVRHSGLLGRYARPCRRHGRRRTGARRVDRRAAARVGRRRLRRRVRRQNGLGRTIMTHPTHPDKTHIPLLNPDKTHIPLLNPTMTHPTHPDKTHISLLNPGLSW